MVFLLGVTIYLLLNKNQKVDCISVDGLSAPLPAGVYNTITLDVEKMYKSGGVK